MLELAERKMSGLYPNDLIDPTLQESLISSNSPIRLYYKEKYSFDQKSVSPFMGWLESEKINDFTFSQVLDTELE